MTITLRVEKGAPLTIAELDGNFTDLDGRLIVVEDGQTSVKSIDEIVQVGNSLVVQYTDSSEDGPFTFEVGITYRGDWLPSTVYAQNDMVKANGVIYIVLLAHTSDTVFDPGASAGTAGDYYAAFLEMPELTIPDGGDPGYVLTKVSATDYDYQWIGAGVPLAGSSGQVLAKLSDDDYDTEWTNISSALPIAVETVSGNIIEPVLADAGKYFRCTAASDVVVSIPLDSEVAFPLGTLLKFRQCSTGVVTLVGDTGLTLNPIDGYLSATGEVGAVIEAIKIDDDEWDVYGFLLAQT